MADLAVLGFEIKSEPAVKAVADLNKLIPAAERTEKAVTAMGAATERSGQRMGVISKASERLERDVQKAQRAMGGMSAASERMVREFGKIEKAADQMDRSLGMAGASVTQIGTTAGAAAAGLQTVAGGLARAGAQAGAANQNIRLTAGQMQGLGYQINDIGTMLALGASPFQVIASQAGQVIQVLGDGPRGIKGSLSAIGSSIATFARAIPAAGYAVAGVTAAVGALWYMTSGPSAREAETTLKDFEGAIKRLETGWKGAAEAAEAYAKAPGRSARDPNATFLDVQGSIRRLQTDLRTQLEDLNSSDLLSGKILRPFAGGVSDARREISSLYADVREAGYGAEQLANEMLRIRLDPKADVYARNFAEEIRQALGPVIELERRVQALNQAAAQLAAPKGTMGRYDLPNEVFTDRFGPTIGGDGRFGDSEGMATIREGLKKQTDALTETTKATRTYADAVAEQRTSIAGSVEALRLQVQTFGQSEGVIAAARFELDAMAEAQRQANDAKAGAIEPALVADIKARSAEFGRLTDQLTAATAAQREQTRATEEAKRQQERVADFRSDLAFERSIAGLPAAEQQVRETIRRLGVDYDSFEGQRLAAEIRYNDSLTGSRDALTDFGGVAQDVFGGMIDALGRGGSLVENLAQAFAGLGKQLASAGLERLLGRFFGSPAGGATGSLSFPAINITTREATGGAATTLDRKVVPAVTKMSGAMDAAARAIRTIESGSAAGNYSAMGPVTRNGDRALGAYQIMSQNLPQWSKAAVGRVVSNMEFLGDPKLQDAIFNHRFGGYMAKYGPSGASRAWFAGEGGMNRLSNKDVVGTSVVGYDSRFTDLFNRNGGAQSQGGGSTSSIDERRATTKAVSDGVIDANRRMSGSADPWTSDGIDMRAVSNPGGMSRGQAGMGAAMGLLGIAANGYSSGNPLMGGFSGALGGLELGGSLASAFPALGAAAGPLGMAAGAPLGRTGPLFRKQRKAA